MNAVILAGGFGSRLSPVTDLLPKPMVSVGLKPMIDYTVSHLWEVGVRDFIFTLSYKPADIIDWCVGYNGATCRFSLESTPLGTLGGVKAVEPFLKEHFIVISGDVIENIDISAMLNKHLSSGALVTMAVKEVEDGSKFGMCEIDGFGHITGFVEKPQDGRGGYANAGVYIVDKSVMSLVPLDVKLDFSKDLFGVLVERGQLSAFIHDGYWRDCGTLQAYYETNFEMLKGGFYKSAPNHHSHKRQGFRTGGEGQSLISTTANVEGDVFNSIVEPGSFVAKSATLTNCIVLENTYVIGSYENAIIGKTFMLPMQPTLTQKALSAYQYLKSFGMV